MNTLPAIRIPDIGEIFVKDEHHYRVTGWMRRAEETPAYYTLLGWLIASTSQWVGPDRCRLINCRREDAQYVSGYGICGCIARVRDVTIIGRVPWPEHVIEEYRWSAIRSTLGSQWI